MHVGRASRSKWRLTTSGGIRGEVEAAVYFCVLEALQNANKYSGSDVIRLTLRHEGGSLRFAVADDGHGFDPATYERGAGLTNIKDRVDALGGDLEIVSSPGNGASIIGRIPVRIAHEARQS